MEPRHARTLEILVVLLVWAGLFMAVVGPAIGAALPGFDRPVEAASDDPSSGFGRLPDTGRGWLLIALGVPVLLGYMFLRPRLSGSTMQEYWNDPRRDGD